MICSISFGSVLAKDSNENVALNKKATGTNAESGSDYSNVVDGDKSSSVDARLSSNVNTMPTVILDLAEEKEVKFFKLFLEDRENVQHKNNVKKYKITFSKEENFSENDYTVERTLDTTTVRDDVLLSKAINIRYVKIEVVETHKDIHWDNAGIVEFELYKNPVNVALGSKATGTNTEGNGNTYEKAVDGDYETRLSSQQNTTPILRLDLGEAKEIQFLRLFVEDRKNSQYKNNVKNYKVTFSNDVDFKEELTSIESELDIETIKDEVVLATPVNARYVKIDGIVTHKDNSWDNAGIVEFEIYDYPFSEKVVTSGGDVTDVRPVYDESLNKIVVPEVDGYHIEIDGVDFEQNVNKNFEVYKPLTEKKVQISLKLTNTLTNEVEITKDFEVLIPGIYDASTGNKKPSVSPELAEWYSDSTNTFIANSDSRIVIDPKHKEALQYMAKEFKADYTDATGKQIDVIYKDNPKAGDFYFTLDTKDSYMGKEGYYMTIADQVTVKALDPIGAYWSTRSLLQVLVQSEDKNELPYGEVRDYPKYEVRGFILDVARKPFSMEALDNIAKNMAWYKMNDLQIHLNDNYIFLEDYGVGETELEAFKAYDAFRLESGIANEKGETPTSKDYAYSKKEFKEFIVRSREMGVNVVPEIDVPAHASSITKVFPEMMVKNGRSPLQNKRPLIDHIDISKPEAVSLIKDIFDDYTRGGSPVFDSDTVVHIGADEFLSNYKAYRDFINEFVPYVKETNTVRMWGGLSWIKDNPITKIDKQSIENVQLNLWSKDWADGMEMYDMGYQLINTIDSYMYMVPNGSNGKGAYNDFLNTDALFNNFEPNVLSTKSGWKSIPAGSDQMLGAAFAIWNDNIDKYASGLTEADLYKRFEDALPVIAEKTWANGKEKGSLSAIRKVSANVGIAPRSNPLMDESSIDGEYATYTFEKGNELKDASKNNRDLSNLKNATFEKGKSSNTIALTGNESYAETPLDKIGDGNTLSFDLKLTKATAGDILFEDDSFYGTHDLRIMNDGKLGFTRELYDYTFDYQVPVGEWVNISIQTLNLKTALYVDDEFIGYALGEYIDKGIVKKSKIGSSTFALPIKRIGSKSNSIQGMIDNVIIEKTNSDANKVPGSNITVEATSHFNGEGPENVIDNDPNTIWHSNWADGSATLPQTLTFTFKEPVAIAKLSYLPRPSNSANGDIKRLDLYVTDENGIEEKIVSDQLFSNDKTLKIIKFDTVIAKKVRIVITGSYGVEQDTHASAAEIAFYKPKEDTNVEPEVSAEGMKELVERYKEKGAFESDRVANALTKHLTAVIHYEKNEEFEKVVKHMEGFKVLLDDQKEKELISDEAYNALKAGADSLIEKYKSEVSAVEIKELVERFAKEGEFENDQTVRSLTTHLTAVAQYEKKEVSEKVVKHMESFKVLLDYQKENKLISEKAYKSLMAETNSLVKKWQ